MMAMEKALLVSIRIKSNKDSWPLEDTAEELEELTVTCGADVLDNVSCQIEKVTPNFYIGSGKAGEIAGICQAIEADTVIFSCDLSGTQQRNLEEIIGKKTIDRTQLILDIFARHAQSPEGKMQVELAQLQYLLPRLVGKGVILSRLGGGIGTRGPGEQKLEVDRRRIRKRIDKLREDLLKFTQHRERVRKKRKENETPTVSLVGYTSAGKSTLINALTNAGQPVAESLFTTLDTVSKGLILHNGEHVIVSDTVGFLHNLPHHLIEAFKATLEEVVDSDLLIHVLDVSQDRVYERNQSVLNVLKELGAAEKPMITALNKIDLLDDKTWLSQLEKDFAGSVLISAALKQNLDVLMARIESIFTGRMVKVYVSIPNSRMDLVSLFYKKGKVSEIKYLSKNIKISLVIPKILYNKLLQDKEINIIN